MSAPGRTPFESVDLKPNGECSIGGSLVEHHGKFACAQPVKVPQSENCSFVAYWK